MNPPLNKTIFVVDDELDVRETLSEALELSGYGSKAIPGAKEALRELSGPEKPSLILLDLMMPGMDGFEFIKARDLISELKNIPIVVISADERVESKVTGLSAKGYLKKPIDLDVLLKTAEQYCGETSGEAL